MMSTQEASALEIGGTHHRGDPEERNGLGTYEPMKPFRVRVSWRWRLLHWSRRGVLPAATPQMDQGTHKPPWSTARSISMGCSSTFAATPVEVASCHTAEVDGYLIEGHVPAEAIERLRAERPDAAVGLALPGMPADSPGMGGDEICWAAQPVVLIGTDGSLTPWAY